MKIEMYPTFRQKRNAPLKSDMVDSKVRKLHEMGMEKFEMRRARDMQIEQIREEYRRKADEADGAMARQTAELLLHHERICTATYPMLGNDEHQLLRSHHLQVSQPIIRERIRKFPKFLEIPFTAQQDDYEYPFFASDRLRQILHCGQFWTFMLGRHRRLGEHSAVQMLNEDVLSIIQKFVMA